MFEFAIKWGTKVTPTENISLCISLLALLATWGNFWNSRRLFAAAHYPKLRAELKLLDTQSLPIYSLFNESDKISANDICITISIARPDKGYFDRERWLTYEYVELERLKPLERFVPSEVNNIGEWCNERGDRQKFCLSQELLTIEQILKEFPSSDLYKICLKVVYTSNVFGANKVCKIYRHYSLISHESSNFVDSRSHPWKLEKNKKGGFFGIFKLAVRNTKTIAVRNGLRSPLQ
jgi:hypothetical protein